jgi:hypothetical protein
MSDVAHEPRRGQRDQFVFALVLIAVGAVGLIVQLAEPSASVAGWIVLAIGLGFVGAFLYTRQYGYLVPGGILSGLGAGIAVSEGVTWTTSEGQGGAVVLGLGLGFVAIWVIGAIMRTATNHIWPLIPGGILAVVGSALLIGREAVDLLDYWGIAVIAIGLLLVWRAWSEGRSKA